MVSVLLLDVDSRPLRIESWPRAMTQLALGRVELVAPRPDRVIRGVSRTWPMPSVVRSLRRFRREKVGVRFSRQNILLRDRYTCQYCGAHKAAAELTFDHVLPRARGGRTTWDNIVAACVGCNRHKANRTPAEARMRLLRNPRRPHDLPILTLIWDDRAVPEEWRPYWTVTLEP